MAVSNRALPSTQRKLPPESVASPTGYSSTIKAVSILSTSERATRDPTTLNGASIPAWDPKINLRTSPSSKAVNSRSSPCPISKEGALVKLQSTTSVAPPLPFPPCPSPPAPSVGSPGPGVPLQAIRVSRSGQRDLATKQGNKRMTEV